jgi:hypothetical protein
VNIGTFAAKRLKVLPVAATLSSITALALSSLISVCFIRRLSQLTRSVETCGWVIPPAPLSTR